MTDRLSSSERSRLMASVRSRDTRPELFVRKLVRSMGIGYRLHRKDLPGKPDLVFIGRRKAIFVHGCFWHRHPGCQKATLPKSNEAFWAAKLNRNEERDRENLNALAVLGWKALVVWECEIRDAERLNERIREFLDPTP